MRHLDRSRAQVAARIVALAFVALWLFSWRLQELVPFWVPFALLLAAELEFLVRGWRERGHETLAPPDVVLERRAPGPDDADLGWGELIVDELGATYVPPPERAQRTRHGRVMAAGFVALTCALFVLAFRVDSQHTWSALSPTTRLGVEQRLSREATTIAGRPARVRCDSDYAYTGIGSDALGIAFPQRHLAYLDPSLCRTLYDLVVRGDRRERESTAQAVLVLAHESVHLAGERDEGVTECKGLQVGVTLGARLGLPRDRAQRMMAALYEADLGDTSIARLRYRLPAGCRNGGTYDIRPGDETFP